MLEIVLDFLFPQVCVNCGKLTKTCQKSMWICDVCYSKIHKYELNSKFYIDNIEIVTLFKYEGIIRKILLKYKFNSCSYICHFFANYILKKFNFEKNSILIPVPMSKKKKNLRGYNQTELICKEISKKNKELEFIDIMQKIDIKTQSTLSREERIKNVENAFFIKEKHKIYLKNKQLILLDDIYTTGATIKECIKILKNYGFTEIKVIILARDFLK